MASDDELKKIADAISNDYFCPAADHRAHSEVAVSRLRALLEKEREEGEDNDEITLHNQLACEKLKVEMLMKKAQPDTLEEILVAAYRLGMGVGIHRYAWWKDGTQYVGTCGTTYEAARKGTKTESVVIDSLLAAVRAALEEKP